MRYEVSGMRYEVSGVRYEVSGKRYEVEGERYEVSCSDGYLGSTELHCKVSNINWNKVAGVGQTLAGGGGYGVLNNGSGFTYWDRSIGGHRDITKLPGYDPLRTTTVLDMFTVNASRNNSIVLDGSSAMNGEGWISQHSGQLLSALGVALAVITKKYGSSVLGKTADAISKSINTGQIVLPIILNPYEYSMHDFTHAMYAGIGLWGLPGALISFGLEMADPYFHQFYDSLLQNYFIFENSSEKVFYYNLSKFYGY